MSIQPSARQPSGVPIGGQFAATAHTEPVNLPALTVSTWTLADGIELARLEEVFDAAGGRGVELADEIDALRNKRDGGGDTCQCGESLEDNEGYDGLCGSCADRAEAAGFWS